MHSTKPKGQLKIELAASIWRFIHHYNEYVMYPFSQNAEGRR